MTPASPASKEEIYPWLVDILHEMFDLDKAKITGEANLYTDLDIDSFRNITQLVFSRAAVREIARYVGSGF